MLQNARSNATKLLTFRIEFVTRFVIPPTITLEMLELEPCVGPFLNSMVKLVFLRYICVNYVHSFEYQYQKMFRYIE